MLSVRKTKPGLRPSRRKLIPSFEKLENRWLLSATLPDFFEVDGSLDAYGIGAVVSHRAITTVPQTFIRTDVLGQPRLDLLPLVDLSDLDAAVSEIRVSSPIFDPSAYVHDGTARNIPVPAQIAIDPNETYVLHAEAIDYPLERELTIHATVTDVDGLTIRPVHVRRFAGATDTTLLQPIVQGDYVDCHCRRTRLE
jgi:hypothetical protein